MVKPLHYFGKDLVLFRTEDGKAHVLDAYCPHLGAHLGYGGQVKGHTIRCPFHGLCFDSHGYCTHTTYAQKLNSNIRFWLVHETNGLILVYYDAQGKLPHWEIPTLPEYNSKEWTQFQPVGRWKIRAHVQDMGENIPDIYHASALHSTLILDHTVFVEGPFWRELFNVKPVNNQKAPFLNIEVVGNYEVTSYGLGYTVSKQRLHHKAMLELRLILRYTVTPIDTEYVDLRFDISVKKFINSAITLAFTKPVFKALKTELEKDLIIWENKIYYSRPLFLEGEEEIIEYRNWANQFYSEIPALNTKTLA
nr:TPA_exp: ArzE - Rieske protein [Fischerella sp. PCC 9339]